MKALAQQIWMILTLDCEGSARLTSESMDRPLNWAERWAVRMHRFVCKKSRKLNRQMLEMHRAMLTQRETNPIGLSHEARERIQDRLEQLRGPSSNGEAP